MYKRRKYSFRYFHDLVVVCLIKTWGLDWKLDLFAPLITTTNYNISSTVVTAKVTVKAHLIFTLLEPVFLPTSRLPWPMPEVLTSTDFEEWCLLGCYAVWFL
jgi:hypothetical protein